MVDLLSVVWTNAISLIIVIPLMGAFLTGLISKLNKKLVFPLALLSLLASFSFTVILASQVYSTGVVARALESNDPSKLTVISPSGNVIPIRIILVADSMSILMTLMASIVSVLAVIYSRDFVKKKVTQFYPLFLIMISGMYGVVLTGDLFNLFVFIEILSISTTGLIVTFDRKRAPDSAFKFIVISSISALMILFGIGILYGQYDALNIAFLAKVVRWSFLDKIAFAILLVALLMKAGAVPIHMWVPDAYGDTPAPVTAFLGATSLASLYVLFRVCFTLFGFVVNTLTVGWILIIIGLLSMFVGVTVALVQNDLKRFIAFQSISQVGFMLIAVGVGLAVSNTPQFFSYGFRALVGGVFHLLNHLIYDGLLFLTAGAIFYTSGTTDLRKVRGLGHKMPFVALFFLVGAFAISGIPPLNGFASKILIYESVYAFNPIISAIAILVSILTLAGFLRAFYSAFLGPNPTKKPKKISKLMFLSMLILTILVILVGLFPHFVVDVLVKPAVMVLINPQFYVEVFSNV